MTKITYNICFRGFLRGEASTLFERLGNTDGVDKIELETTPSKERKNRNYETVIV